MNDTTYNNIERPTCLICGESGILAHEHDERSVCRLCNDRYGPLLTTAALQEGEYVIEVEGIGLLNFTRATLQGDWLTIYSKSDALYIPCYRIIYAAEAKSE